MQIAWRCVVFIPRNWKTLNVDSVCNLISSWSRDLSSSSPLPQSQPFLSIAEPRFPLQWWIERFGIQGTHEFKLFLMLILQRLAGTDPEFLPGETPTLYFVVILLKKKSFFFFKKISLSGKGRTGPSFLDSSAGGGFSVLFLLLLLFFGSLLFKFKEKKAWKIWLI